MSEEKPVNKLLANARRRARTKGLPFNLTKDWLQERLDTGRCQATDLPFYTEGAHAHEWFTHPRAPSVHRVNSKKGYTVDNVLLVVWQYNCALNHWPEHYLHELSLSVLGLYPRRNR